MIAPVITQQVVMNLSIITAVILSLQGFFANMTAGRFGFTVHETTDQSSYEASNKASRGTKRAIPKAHSALHFSSNWMHESADSQLRSREGVPRSHVLRPDVMSKSKAWARYEQDNEWEDRRSDGSQENIIRQKMTWQVSRNSPKLSRGDDELSTLPANDELRETRERNFLL